MTKSTQLSHGVRQQNICSGCLLYKEALLPGVCRELSAQTVFWSHWSSYLPHTLSYLVQQSQADEGYLCEISFLQGSPVGT